MARELGSSQISALLESVPGIVNVLRSPVADAMVAMIRAGAGLESFHMESARELVQYAVRRGLISSGEGDQLLADVKATGAGKGQRRKAGPRKAPAPRTPPAVARKGPWARSAPHAKTVGAAKTKPQKAAKPKPQKAAKPKPQKAKPKKVSPVKAKPKAKPKKVKSPKAKSAKSDKKPVKRLTRR